MIETDAPYLVPRSIKPNKARPGRNEPALLSYVLQVSSCKAAMTTASFVVHSGVETCGLHK